MVKIPKRLVFLDVETTGLDSSKDRVIEIFLLSVHKDGQVEQYETLINPERPIPEVITEMTGLTDVDVAHAPTESQVAKKIREFIGWDTPVAHNLPFDLRFLNAMFQRNGLLELSGAGIDTLAISRELFPRLAIFPEGGGSHRLSNLMYHFGLEKAHANAHRAKDDVLLLVEVYRHLQASERGELLYSPLVTHGCPTCKSAMYVEREGNQRVLVCKTEPSCAAKFVV